MNFIFQAFILGFTSVASCIPFCGLTLATYLGASPPEGASSKVLLFFSGRFLAYLLSGLLIGWIGTVFSFVSYSGIIYILSGVVLLLSIYWGKKGCEAKELPRKDWNVLMVGFILGMRPCAPFISLAVLSLQAGSLPLVVGGFIAFFFSSSLLLLPAVFSVSFAHRKVFRQVCFIVLIIVAVGFIAQGIWKLGNGKVTLASAYELQNVPSRDFDEN